ncbi:MAG: MurR/RpiR family transcriptional regulator [Clostridium sp.]|nr:MULTISPECIES: MurR/RpiR family transcriptional regulator [Clostridium]MDU3407840.1 MurR/RpiR family transcriptional regulator [Clostridium sp.]MDU6362728.1 MurR/RpiR family transcriptional regulator [Clostridium sp.]
MMIEELMNRYYENLNENDKLICKYIINNKDTCYKLSIDKFASKCNVSTTTLFRFAKKISLPGFSELKARLRLEVESRTNEKSDFLTTVTSSYHKLVEDIKNRDCDNIFENIYKSKRIIVFGSGYAQARVASEFKRIFLPTEKIIFNMHGYDMVDAVGKLAKEDDFVVIISLSGESKGVIKLAETLRLNGVKTLSITRMMNNSLAALCSENLYINSIQLPKEYILDYEISTPYFILIELLFLKYQKYLAQL